MTECVVSSVCFLPAFIILGRIFLFFPKNVDGQPLLTKDFSNVRFYSEVGKQVKLDVRFKVADMYYNGRLEY